jgi:hypothetical protein
MARRQWFRGNRTFHNGITSLRIGWTSVATLAELGLRAYRGPRWRFSTRRILFDTTVVAAALGVLVAMIHRLIPQ